MTEQKSPTAAQEDPIIEHAGFDPEDEYRPEPEPEPQPPFWMDGSLRIGIHTSIAKSYIDALDAARKLGCNALQIFSASPRMWQGGPARIAEVDAQAFRAKREELRLGPLVIHANYLINLASEQRMLQTRSIQGFHEEIVRATQLGADFLVVHPGARGSASMGQAIATIIESVKQAMKRVPMGGLKILIENTAGMGSAVGSRLEEMAEILAGLQALPVEACLDTAHLLAAGYDIKSESGLAATLGQIENTIRLNNVPVTHANDSKIELGGRVDRHEHIGKGKIGAEAFARILRHPRLGAAAPEGLTGRVFIAETPIEDPGDDRRNVAKLWELAGLADQAPEADKSFSMLTPALKKKMAEQKRKSSTQRAQRTTAQSSQRRNQKSSTRRAPRAAAQSAQSRTKSGKGKAGKKKG